MAGTRPRGSDAEEDQQLGRDLMASPKDMSENRIVAEFLQVGRTHDTRHTTIVMTSIFN